MAVPNRRRQRVRLALSLCLPLMACVPRAPVPPPRPAPPRAPPAATLRQAMLAAHAQARARVGLAPLAWDETLAAHAAGWAATLARGGGLAHAPQEAEGENLWEGTRGAYGYAEMAGGWLAERRARGETGHYTQIVWRDTRRVGCALASNARDDVLVCRYWPAGNVEDEQAY